MHTKAIYSRPPGDHYCNQGLDKLISEDSQKSEESICV